MNTTSALASRPCIMYSGLCRPETYRACPCSSDGSRLFIVPCESLHTISVAPASSAPSIAALTSPSSRRRPSSYACPGPRHCDQSTIPATPSMSNEIKIFTKPPGGCPGLRAGEEPGTPQRGRRRTKAATRTARLSQFFDHTYDNSAVRTAYRCRAYPDQEQQAVLNRTFGCIRVVWNRTLAARYARWHQAGTGTSYAETDRALTAMRKDRDLAFLTEVSCVPLQQALRNQHQAFGAFFARRARAPRFKSRRSRQSAHYTRSAFTLRGGELRLARMATPLRFVWSRPEADLTSLDPTMVIISREPDGRWYVTFTVEAAAPQPLQQTEHAIGVDLGVIHFAATSDGDTIANPRHLERKARRLARYQRRLARCPPESANRAKAAAKVARAHRKVRNARADFLHRASTRLVRDNDVIVIEDLAVENMVK